ncbi:MAG: type VI secretion system Vgr family protein [Mariniblastus sp.]
MADLANPRKMRLTTPLGDEALAITSLEGTESLSELYSFQLNVQSPKRKPVDFNAILGQDVRVDIELPNPNWQQALTSGQFPSLRVRRFCGLVQRFTEISADTHFCYYQMHIQPRFWLWTRKSDCRTFQEKNVTDILKEVLEGLNVEFRLHSNYHTRPFCVQYNETTFDFASRLMAEEGIFFFFEHQYKGQDNEKQQRGEKLIVTDSVVNLPFVTSPDSGEEEIPRIKFDSAVGGIRTDLRISKWHKSQQIVSSKCTLRDHTFQLPGQSLETDEGVPDQVQIGGHSHKLAPIDHELEVYSYPGQFAKQFDGIGPGGGERPGVLKNLFKHNDQFAKREIERHASDSLQIDGESDCPHLVPGSKFALEKDRVISGPYFVKSVRHIAKLNAEFRAGAEPKTDSNSPHEYTNEFTCQAEVQPYQPTQKSSRPMIHGFQTATVVGPEGEEIFSDKFGRIKVQFHWDRVGKNDADSSCWIRVAQVWAGNRWGAFFWPRVGHEVVVSFENGDPDSPLIVGSVYNAKNMPPMPLPDRLQSGGIKSCSVGGNPTENYSCVIFHDGVGQEYLQMHSETHECMTSETSKLNFSPGRGVNLQGTDHGLLSHFGSGSGGGPSQPTDSDSSGQPDSQEVFEQQLKTILSAFGPKGSGSGGMITEILEGAGVHGTGHGASETAEKLKASNTAGQLSMVSGDSIITRLGAKFEHCFNANVKVSADIEEMVRDFVVSFIGGAPASKEMCMAGAWGAGGFFSQVYGNRQTVSYGHDVKVRRGHELLCLEDHFFAAPCTTNPSVTPALLGIRTTTHVAILALAMVIILMDIAVAIATKAILECAPREH